jgi:hypothetical protein
MIAVTEIITYPKADLIPLGDIHLGDEYFTKKSLLKLKGYIDWVKQNPQSRVVLTGDIFNVATRASKTSPFSRNWVEDEVGYAVDLFEPIKNQIISAVDGNHENRLLEFANYSLIKELCYKLSTKEHKIIYCAESCVLFLKVGKKLTGISKKYRNEERSDQTYSVYIHHTCGGGSTVGGKLNRVDKLRQIISGCDVYIGAHNHLSGAVKTKIYIPDNAKRSVKEIRQVEVDAGSFLEYGGYSERGQMAPVDIGAPRITFFGNKHDVHVSL